MFTGNYIMFASATSGDRDNNNKFSSCSIQAWCLKMKNFLIVKIISNEIMLKHIIILPDLSLILDKRLKKE